MKNVLRRVLATAVAAASIGAIGVVTHPASAGTVCAPAGVCITTTGDQQPGAVGLLNRTIADTERTAAGYVGRIGGGGDVCQPILGGVNPPPLPGPTPGVRPCDAVGIATDAVNGIADGVTVGAVDRTLAVVVAIVGRGGEVCQPILGGVNPPPAPGPTPGLHPGDLCNATSSSADTSRSIGR